MLNIEVNDFQSHLKGHKGRVTEALRYLLREEGLTDCSLSVALVDEARIQDLNERFGGRDEPTDVISFDLSEGSEAGELSGEVVVSAERAVSEAAERGGDPVGELLLYAVHGVLHLIGYNDQTPVASEKMQARENEILTALGHPELFSGPEGRR